MIRHVADLGTHTHRAAGGCTLGLGARGATMVEYSIVLGLIAVACVVVVGVLGLDVLDLFRVAEQNFDPTP